MGKYMRKSKTTGEVAVLEVVSQPSLGVKTRAKTLALQDPAKSSYPPSPSPAFDGGGSYLQLRSRRLAKPPILVISRSGKRRKQAVKETCAAQNPNPNNPQNSNSSSRAGSRVRNSREGWVSVGMNEMTDAEIRGKASNGESYEDLDVEASIGENVSEIEGRERTTRESTPCDLIMNSETIRTPGSTSNPNFGSTSTNPRSQSLSHCYLPTKHEMEEFFASAEEEQQKEFIDKYNFDPVNDKPLPGRYQWEKGLRVAGIKDSYNEDGQISVFLHPSTLTCKEALKSV